MFTQRNWNTGLPSPTMFSIQRGTLAYSYKGVAMLKNPFDLALYMDLLWKAKPRTILEIGSYSGGSAIWFGDLFDNYGIDGHVYSVDIKKIEGVSHPRATFFQGDGRNLAGTFTPEFLEKLPRPWLVIEDADHFHETTQHVLDFFHRHLRRDEYIVIEDGIVANMGESQQYHGGPLRAVWEFLSRHGSQYEIDTTYCDRFGHNFTWNTNGYLRKLQD